MNLHTGWLLVIVGLATAVVGLMWMFGPNMSWLGRLPGDIRIESGDTRLYIPITTCALVSLVLSAIAFLIRRFAQ